MPSTGGERDVESHWLLQNLNPAIPEDLILVELWTRLVVLESKLCLESSFAGLRLAYQGLVSK